MRDYSGISLSVSNPDNLETPTLITGAADDASDYCETAGEWGDSVAGMLDAVDQGTTPGSNTGIPLATGRPGRRARRGGLLLLAGGVVLGFMLLMVLSEG